MSTPLLASRIPAAARMVAIAMGQQPQRSKLIRTAARAVRSCSRDFSSWVGPGGPYPRAGGNAASSSAAATGASAAVIAAASTPATRVPAATAPSQPLTFTLPTAQQLQQLHARLSQPYASTAAIAAAVGGRKRGAAALRPVAGECRVLSLDVGDRYVGVALSDGGSGGGIECAGTGNRRAAPLLTLHRKHLVSAPVPAPLSIHSHHSRPSARRHTDLRGPGSAPGRVLRPRSLADVGAEVRDLLRLHRCVGVVVGMPLTMAYGLDEQCTKTIEFVRQLQRAMSGTRTDTAATAAATAAAASTGSRGKAVAPPLLPPFQPPAWFFWDERLTSVDARHQLEHGAGLRAHTRAMAQSTDPLAAAIILQEFLDRMHLTNQEFKRSSS